MSNESPKEDNISRSLTRLMDDMNIHQLPIKGITRASPIVKGTTLFDPIAYHGVDKDEANYVMEQIRIERVDDPNFGTDENDPDFMIYKLTGFNRGEEPFDAGPVIQVVSVCVLHTLPDWKLSDIYGQISLTNCKGESFLIYKREPQDPEEIYFHQELSIACFPLAPGTRGKFAFSLFTSHRTNIFDQDSDLYVDYFDSTEDMGKESIVKGKYGYYAKIVYNIIPYAIIAKISMKLVGPANDRLNTIHVEGDVTANISSTHSNASNIPLLKHKEFKVSRKGDKQYNYPIPLSRTSIAMPAYSLLPVEFSLTMDGTVFAKETVENDPIWPNGYGVFVPCVDRNFHIGLSVDWLSPDEAFDLFPESKGPLTSDHYVEIFSVIVGCSNALKPFPAVCGTIVITNLKEAVYIFSREVYCLDDLSQRKRSLSLTWPNDRWILEKNFFMHLKLKDGNGDSVCRGYLSWDCDSDDYPSRFDRRLCSVIRGENGYFAAVHYSIFRDGLRAKMTVIIDCEGPCDNFDVFGSIFAEYDNYDYPSMYEQYYYRINIFARDVEYCANVINGSEIPLSKSLVTAPADCKGLFVSVDLNVRAFENSTVASSFDLTAMKRLGFTAGVDDSQQLDMYRGPGGEQRRCGRVTVKVSWFDCSHGYRLTDESMP